MTFYKTVEKLSVMCRRHDKPWGILRAYKWDIVNTCDDMTNKYDVRRTCHCSRQLNYVVVLTSLLHVRAFCDDRSYTGWITRVRHIDKVLWAHISLIQVTRKYPTSFSVYTLQQDGRTVTRERDISTREFECYASMATSRRMDGQAPRSFTKYSRLQLIRVAWEIYFRG